MVRFDPDGEVEERSNVQKMHIANSDKPFIYEHTEFQKATRSSLLRASSPT